MSFPAADPHRDEPTRELDRETWRLWKQAQRNADGWQSEANRLRTKLLEQLGDAYAATVDGLKVFTYRPQDRYATTSLLKDYPALASHFMREKTQEVFDMEAFAKAHPEVADKYRVRSFRRLEEE